MFKNSKGNLFGVKNAGIGAENAYFWDTNVE